MRRKWLTVVECSDSWTFRSLRSAPVLQWAIGGVGGTVFAPESMNQHMKIIIEKITSKAVEDMNGCFSFVMVVISPSFRVGISFGLF